MARQKTKPGQVYPSRAERIDDGGQFASEARNHDAVEGDVPREAQFPQAKREHRGKRALEVQLARVDLGEMFDEVGFEDARTTRESVRGSK
ncbi:MAG: hypothetical protein ACJ78Y_07320 [Myxococcales bacterium]